MNVVSHGPFRVGSQLWQPAPGAWSLTVVCRAGFQLTPGVSPIVTLPKEASDEERRLLEHEVTQAPAKRWPEVLVVGHAHAPEGQPSTSLVARLAVGDLDKAIQVIGDRHFTMEGELRGPAPFTKMPLVWDRAAGGPDNWNPVGVVLGAYARADGWGRVPLPNLEPAGASITTRHDLVPPVGFGPIAPRWPTRAARLHRHASTWDPATWTERPFPADFDFAWFNAAPPDQALAELAGDEKIVLEHLHPRHARLATHLAVVAPRATAGFDGVSREIPLRCDTLIIDADLGIAELVWRGQVTLSHPKQTGIVIVQAAATAPQAAPNATMVLADPAPAAARKAMVETIAAPFAPPRVALPFAGGPASSPAPASAPRAPTPPSGSAGLTIAPFRAAPKPTLPFGEQAAAPAPRVEPTPVLAPVPAAPRFGAPPPEPVPVMPRFGAPPLATFEARAPEPVAAPILPLEARAPEQAPPPPAENDPPPPPPAMLGPLATMEMFAADAAAAAEREDAALPIEAYPIDRCARIAAKIARRPEERAATLEAEALKPRRWEALHAHWQQAIRAQTDRGRKALLRAYDAAYVGQIEEERGAITAEEYARLVIAAERGRGEAALGEMGLPKSAMMRLRRVWIGRTAKDRELAKGTKAARRAVMDEGG